MPRTGRNFEGKRHAKGGMPLFFDFDCYFFSFIGRWTLDALYPYGVKTQFRFRHGNHVPDVLVHL